MITDRTCDVCGTLWTPRTRYQAARNKTCGPTCMAVAISRKRADMVAPLIDRLMARISVDHETGCWNWTAGTVRGYGSLKHDGISIGAHRASYEHHHGPIPDGLCACHKCDNRACINPEHLFLGSQAENVADMDAKGRRVSPKGSGNSQAKINEADVMAIRAAVGVTHKALGERYGITRSAVQAIRAGRNWGHVALVAAQIRKEIAA